jgi:hypothetical protein
VILRYPQPVVAVSSVIFALCAPLFSADAVPLVITVRDVAEANPIVAVSDPAASRTINSILPEFVDFTIGNLPPAVTDHKDLVKITEPPGHETEGGSTYSDIFVYTVVMGATTDNVKFYSDGGSFFILNDDFISANFPGYQIFSDVEDGTFRTLIDLALPPGSRWDSIIYEVASDVPDIPEPTSLTLLGFGLAALGLMRRRRTQRPG